MAMASRFMPAECLPSGKKKTGGPCGAAGTSLPQTWPYLVRSTPLAMSTSLVSRRNRLPITQGRPVRGRRGPRTDAPSRSGFCLGRFPDADVPSFRHQEKGKDEAHSGNDDWIEQCVPEAAGRRERRRRDERHQAAAPAVADVIWHRHRGVADAGREELRQERANRPVDHADIVYEDGDDQDRDRIVDVA